MTTQRLSTPPSEARNRPVTPWWVDAVIYQVYPRSFADADGDGMGDLRGVTSRLDYLAQLGVDAIWLSPFYLSPQHDAGYDVADYRAVDPRFGTLADADEMIAAAHEAGIRVVVDLVPNHTSSEHAWFQAALAAAPGSPERARYHFAEGRGEHGELPPNNWESTFGGGVGARVREAVAGGVAHRVVVREHPGVRGADPAGLLEGPVDRVGQRGGVPAGHEVGEVEGLVHLAGADVPEHARERGHPRLGHHHRLVVVGVQDPPPVPVDLVDAVLVHERGERLEGVRVERGVGVLARVRDHAHAGVLTAAVSAINACIYASGRLLYAMAHDGQAPRAFTHTNRGGVPWLSVAVTLGVMVLGAVLITVDPNAFSLVAGVASFAVVLTWAMIFLSHRAMRRRVAEQGAEPSPFPMPLGGVGTYLGLAFVATVVITMATIPDSRQALIISLVWVAVLTLAWFVTGTRTSAAAHDRTGTLPVVRTRQSHED